MAIFKNFLIYIAIATAVGTASATPVQAPEAGALLKRNGCFSSGTEFSTGGFTVDTLASACSSSFDGSYSSTQTKSTCINGSNGKRLNLSVKNNESSNQELIQDACIAAMTIEFDACSHGSEQNHGNFHYTLDPNAGAC